MLNAEFRMNLSVFLIIFSIINHTISLSSNASIQLSSFSTAHVRSNPILLIDEKTIFVPNLHYAARDEDVHFWVGKSTEPRSDGTAISDENGSMANLHTYQGQNIYLKLSGDLHMKNIQYLAIWSNTTQSSLAYVNIDGSIDLPAETNKQDRPIIRLPKCCSYGTILTSSGCKIANESSYNPKFHIFEHNATHINNQSLDSNRFLFIPYIYYLECPAGRFPLDEEKDDFGVMVNGSLIVRDMGIIFDQGSFCTENIEGENDTVVLLCAPEVPVNKAMFSVYLTLVVTSILCFLAVFIFYYHLGRAENMHDRCMMAYVLCMFITFFWLMLVQIIDAEDLGCKIVGFCFEFSMIMSFVWLAIICYDILYLIICNDDPKDRGRDGRIYYYLGLSFAIPVLFIIISLCRNLMPDVPDSFFKPQYGGNTCSFERSTQRRIVFYIPIGVSVISSAVCLAIGKYKMIQNEQELMHDYFWIENRQDFKFKYWHCVYIGVIMLIGCITEIISNSIDGTSGVFNAMVVLEALQGFFIALILLMHFCTVQYRIFTKNDDLEMTSLKRFISDSRTFRRYLIIYCTMALWLVETFVRIFVDSDSGLMSAFDLIEAMQGIFILFLIVCNRRAIKEAMKHVKKKKKRQMNKDDVGMEEMISMN